MTAISTLGMNPARRRIEEAGILYQQEKAREAADRRVEAVQQAIAAKLRAQASFKAAAARAALVSRPMQIVREVAEKHGLTPEQLTGRSHATVIILARHEAMWEVRKTTRLSLTQIGTYFGGRDHTTALNGIRKHDLRLKGALPRQDLIDHVTAVIAAAPSSGVSSEDLRKIVLASGNPTANIEHAIKDIMARIRANLTFRSLRLVSTRPGNGWAHYRIEPAQGGGAS